MLSLELGSLGSDFSACREFWCCWIEVAKGALASFCFEKNPKRKGQDDSFTYTSLSGEMNDRCSRRFLCFGASPSLVLCLRVLPN